MHLVLISRKDPPLGLDGLRARHQVTEIRNRELRFTWPLLIILLVLYAIVLSIGVFFPGQAFQLGSQTECGGNLLLMPVRITLHVTRNT